ncbi:hypothetical protein AMJ44_11015 [candidate division WOR-1 bacterium DG_54_3]|uniref:CopG family transcriptional regulator n=1 Tax=candidate division WOR-1 bacterium DG_54_3 TaxID=1703775 RepID=A0A0S7XSP9_UNCSA|nr:MAG: hypothetical protein AMJ44_11015 [candidate division WOR-1 bacterium DG_54_3]
MNYKKETRDDFSELKRIPIYIYNAQLKKFDEICQKRKKTRRIVFCEAFQTYISLYIQGQV